MATQQEDLLREVFFELQDLGLILPTHKLVPFKKGGPERRPRLHAGIVPRHRIYYWLDDFLFDADGMRFVLLHEERHLRGYLSHSAYFLSIAVWAAIFFDLILTGHLQRPPWSSLVVLIVPAVWYTAMPFLRIDETRCDLWAARQLKIEFGIDCPSAVARKALTLPKLDSNRTQKAFQFLGFRVFHVDYHPPLEKRIARIARGVDDIPRIHLERYRLRHYV